MASIDFAATHNGETYTRSSGTMPYTHITVGSQVIWHKSYAAAVKAASSRQQTWNTHRNADIVPVIAEKFNGKVSAEWAATAETGWGEIPAEVMANLLAAKAAPKVETVAVDKPAKETPAQARARQRAAKKLRDQRAAEEAVVQAEMDRQAELRAQAAKEVPVADVYPGEAEFDKLRAAKEARQRVAPAKVEAAPKAEVDVASMVLVKVDGKPQARLDTTSGTLVWRNSAKGRAARAAGIWA